MTQAGDESWIKETLDFWGNQFWAGGDTISHWNLTWCIYWHNKHHGIPQGHSPWYF